MNFISNLCSFIKYEIGTYLNNIVDKLQLRNNEDIDFEKSIESGINYYFIKMNINNNNTYDEDCNYTKRMIVLYDRAGIVEIILKEFLHHYTTPLTLDIIKFEFDNLLDYYNEKAKISNKINCTYIPFIMLCCAIMCKICIDQDNIDLISNIKKITNENLKHAYSTKMYM